MNTFLGFINSDNGTVIINSKTGKKAKKPSTPTDFSAGLHAKKRTQTASRER